MADLIKITSRGVDFGAGGIVRFKITHYVDFDGFWYILQDEGEESDENYFS